MKLEWIQHRNIVIIDEWKVEEKREKPEKGGEVKLRWENRRIMQRWHMFCIHRLPTCPMAHFLAVGTAGPLCCTRLPCILPSFEHTGMRIEGR